MMKNLFAVAGTCAFALMFTASAQAGNLNLNQIDKNTTSNIIKTHSSSEVHDMLHRYGYNTVIYLGSRDENYDGRPTYKFSACKHGTKYIVYASWYGEILNTRHAGQCYRDNDYDDDREYRPRPSW